MGFNKCILPPIKELKQILKDVGEIEFIKRYQKCDSIMGETEAMDFLYGYLKNT
jgi:hypothetical protein